MAEGLRKAKKRNFTEVKVETLGIGITNHKKKSEWQHVAAALNSVSSTERTVPELKKKWSDIKVHIFM